MLDRNDDMLTLQFRDYPRLPKFFRHRTAIALISLCQRSVNSACRNRLGPAQAGTYSLSYPYNSEVHHGHEDCAHSRAGQMIEPFFNEHASSSCQVRASPYGAWRSPSCEAAFSKYRV